MRVSEALDAVNKIYKVGIADFYSKQKPDPWMKAHEDLEKVMFTHDEQLVKIAAQRFFDRCQELVIRFNKESDGTEKIIPELDGFYLGDPNRVDEAFSVKQKACVNCFSTKDIKLVSTDDGVNVKIICKQCDLANNRNGR